MNDSAFIRLRLAALERVIAGLASRQGVPAEKIDTWIEAAADHKDAAALMNATADIARTLRGH
ncbi:hypothetical protein [Sinorhizobium fredii]|uniref:hypothetical protein n=1 Tax=Rhizobium fredii TaxID=380 RepID=UPI003512A216